VPGKSESRVAVAARPLAVEGGVEAAPSVATPWVDLDVRVGTGEGRRPARFRDPEADAP
jgi:hypothetical protein